MDTEKTSNVPMKDRPPEMQPRERLMNDSAQSLSTAELLAILLRTGTTQDDVLQLAGKVLTEAGGLEGMLQQNMASLCKIKGIGEAKACTLLAAIELGRRLMLANRAKREVCIDSSIKAAEVIRSRMRYDEQEAFHVLYLDVKNRLIDEKELFVGTVNGANVHQRDIFREAVRLNAVRLIVGHNHPSGDLSPSKEDILLTRRIEQAASIIGIEFLDHVIVGTILDNEYFSFKEHGYLDG